MRNVLLHQQRSPGESATQLETQHSTAVAPVQGAAIFGSAGDGNGGPVPDIKVSHGNGRHLLQGLLLVLVPGPGEEEERQTGQTAKLGTSKARRETMEAGQGISEQAISEETTSTNECRQF